MGLKRYRGPIETVEQAQLANLILVITCQRCSRSSRIWAYRLLERWPQAAGKTLHKAEDGFWCRGCRRRVQAWISTRVSGEP
jgi:hypothetical protein